MREPRAATLKLSKERPQKSGRFKKEIVIELYPARQWSEKYAPYSSPRKDCAFFIKYPVKNIWKSFKPLSSDIGKHYYRLMVNGKWHQQDGYRYSFFTKEMAYKLLKEIGE